MKILWELPSLVDYAFLPHKMAKKKNYKYNVMFSNNLIFGKSPTRNLGEELRPTNLKRFLNFLFKFYQY